MTNKNPTIDVAKGIAIILVIYGHLIEHSLAPFSQDFFQNPIFKIIYTFHMPLFVFISGYLMFGSLTRNSVKDVFKSRCKSLLVPFVSLAVLVVILTYGLNLAFGKNVTFNIGGDLADQLFLKPLVWFLFSLFAFSSFVCLSFILEKRLGVIAFAVVYLLLILLPFTSDCVLYYVKWFYLFYVAGYFYNRYNIQIKNSVVRTIMLTISLVIFTMLVSYWTKDDFIYVNKLHFITGHYFEGFLRLIYRYILGFLGILIAFYLASFMAKTKTALLMGFIGVYSLDIYIIQMFLVEGIYPRFIYKYNIQLDFNSPLVIGIIAPLLTIFFVGACFYISKFLIRRIPILNTIFLGGRTEQNKIVAKV